MSDPGAGLIEHSVPELVRRQEGLHLDRKASVFLDHRAIRTPERIADVMVTVASLLNAEGGVVLAGVEDDGTIVGIEKDFAATGRGDAEAWRNEFRAQIKSHLGALAASPVRIELADVASHVLAAIRCPPASEPVWLRKPKEKTGLLFIREDAQTTTLRDGDAASYCIRHWGKTASLRQRDAPGEVGAAQRLEVTRRPGLSATLARLYPAYELLKFGDLLLPISVIAAPEPSWGDLEDALEDLNPQPLAPRGVFASDFDPGLEPLYRFHQATAHPEYKFDAARTPSDDWSSRTAGVRGSPRAQDVTSSR